jgi:hypothetical protein
MLLGAIGGPLGGTVGGVLGSARLWYTRRAGYIRVAVGIGTFVGVAVGGLLGLILGKLARVERAWSIGMKVGGVSGFVGATVGEFAIVTGAGAFGGMLMGGLVALLTGVVLAAFAVLGRLSD